MRHHPRKRFGQNFLQDRGIIDQILIAIDPQAEDNMLEIGPGLGALTNPLLRYLNQLTVIEIDSDLQQHLIDSSPCADKLQVISADALTVNYNQFGNHLRIVGNLPYNISTPLLIRLLQSISHIKDMVFMLQKEVVERMAATCGTKAYGRLSIMLQYYCEVEHLFDVPPQAFSPQPKVNSAMVRLVPYSTPPYALVKREKLEYLVAKAFAMRRKTLMNNLKGFISPEDLLQLGVDSSLRPEQIEIEKYAQMAKFISN